MIPNQLLTAQFDRRGLGAVDRYELRAIGAAVEIVFSVAAGAKAMTA
jgi:hypothetical protein